MNVAATSVPSRDVHPALFLVLYLPFGISAGYVTVSLAYLLTQAGISVQWVAALVALSLFPLTWKVIWAPMVDSFLTYKSWYVLSTVATALGVAATGFVPATKGTFGLIEGIVFIFSLTSSAITMTTDGLIAHTVAPERKGRAAGWAQAGNVGGGSIGGGVALWVAAHTHLAWTAGVVAAAISLAAITALFFIDEPEHAHRVPRLAETAKNIAKDIWSMARSRPGFLGLVLVALPAGTGAASNLWSAVASDWHASADLVALSAGVLGGVVAMIGSIVAGPLFDRFDRKRSYMTCAILMAICALAMAAAPRTPAMFLIFTLLYALANGAMYAAYGAVMLEAIGRGAAATKSPLFASIANIPIAIMTMIDGAAQARWGSGGMLLAEAAVAVTVMIAFAIFAAATRPSARALASQPG
jgi:MFS family permease